MKPKFWQVEDRGKIYFIREWFVHGETYYKYGSYYTDGSGHKEDWYPNYRGARERLLTDKRLKLKK